MSRLNHSPNPLVPAKAGTQGPQAPALGALDSRFRGNERNALRDEPDAKRYDNGLPSCDSVSSWEIPLRSSSMSKGLRSTVKSGVARLTFSE
jgi:hypothetical protein